MVVDLHPGTMATLLYAEYDPGAGELRIACAGHPAPLRGAGRRRGSSNASPATPIGVQPDFECEEAVHRMTAGTTLLLFTDGLVERRTAADRPRAGRASSPPARAAHDADVEALCDHVTAAMDVAASTDDVALLAVRPVSLAGEPLRVAAAGDAGGGGRRAAGAAPLASGERRQ